MIGNEMDSKILRDNNGNMLCSKHKLLASSICIEENCTQVLNCVDCSILDNHFHRKNISIPYILNKDMDNQMYNEEFYDQEKVIGIVKKEVVGFRNNFKSYIDLFENKMLDKITNETKEFKIIENKNIFQKSREDFLKDNNNLDLLKKLAENFFSFSKIRNSEDYLYSENILDKIKKGLEEFKTKIKNIIGDFDIKRKITKNHFEDSKIISENDIDFTYYKLFEKKLKNTKLLYRGSENEFSAKKFRELCLNKGPTISIIKSDCNKVFGGYIKESWKGNGKVGYCKDGFIFSIDKKEKFKQKNNNKRTFYNCTTNMLSFGSGCDFKIYDQCNIKKENYSNFGISYELPIDLISNTIASQSYLAGKYVFSVKEIEIYSIELN